MYVFVPEGSMSIIDKFLSNKLVSIGVSIFVGLILCGWNFFAWQNYYNWCNNPSFEKNKKDTTPIPKNMEDLSYEDNNEDTEDLIADLEQAFHKSV